MEGEPVPGTLHAGREVYLNDTASVFSLVPQRNARSVASFTVKDGKVPLTILKQDRFPKLEESPPDALGKTFVLRSESGKNVSLKVQAKESSQKATPREKAPREKAPDQEEARPRSKAAPKKKVASKKVPSKERKK